MFKNDNQILVNYKTDKVYIYISLDNKFYLCYKKHCKFSTQINFYHIIINDLNFQKRSSLC